MSPVKEASAAGTPAAGETTAWITRIATWAAPTTVVTALLFFFGYVYTSAYYDYFGIDSSTLGFDTREVLVKGESPLFLPAGVVAFVALVLALLFHMASRFIRQGRDGARMVRRAGWATTVAALVLLVFGFLAGLQVIRPGSLGTPLMIGGALLLIVLARILIRRSSGGGHALSGERAAMGIAVAITALCMFWAATSYASDRGSAQAKMVGRNLYTRPAVILDTTERLHLDLSACADPNSRACRKSEWNGLRETALPDAGQQDRFRYRYHGLRLLAQSGDRMFLLPDHWTWEHGDLLILPMDANVRVALHPG
ncbi:MULTISPECIES: hypothetical protein [Kitasatospora]|uniref:DUF5671 domain-containing protein n=1 Tax=Kitasatospora cathayae TaxID=3004092 RepID=A0ABY7QCD2_9ACTN|nr:hypothetical protein [Kitasatospora sp. HUAS 3-15]WBP90267.1 hypothetical protein O1G21_33335 [Kitasatospora sp. HUAS 3-15]